MDYWQAGYAAGAVEADTGNVLQKARAVAGSGSLRGNILLAAAGRILRKIASPVGGDDDWGQGLCCQVCVIWMWRCLVS